MGPDEARQRGRWMFRLWLFEALLRCWRRLIIEGLLTVLVVCTATELLRGRDPAAIDELLRLLSRSP